MFYTRQKHGDRTRAGIRVHVTVAPRGGLTTSLSYKFTHAFMIESMSRTHSNRIYIYISTHTCVNGCVEIVFICDKNR